MSAPWFADLRARAERVLAGTQTGRYKKHEMARDVLALCDIADAAHAYVGSLDTNGQADDDDLRAALARVCG